VTEGRVVDHDVSFGDAFGFQVGFEDFVGGAGIHIVSTRQNPALDTLIHQVINSGNSLLVGCSTGVEHVFGRLFTLVLNRVKEQAVEFFNNRQNGFTGYGCPATKNDIHFFFFKQLAGFFCKQRPVGRRVYNNGFELLAEQATLFVLLFHHHQDGVFQCCFTDGHGAGQ